MSNQYTSIPREINIKEITKAKYSLSPSHYQRLKITNTNTKSVREFLDRDLTSADKGIEVGSDSYLSNSTHFFLRTKALQLDSFLANLTGDSCVPILPSSFKNYDLKSGDILISKDSNIGEVVILDKDLPNYMISSGIYRLPISKLKYYFLAFLKNEFFRTQLLFLRGATIRHAKTLFLNCRIPLPNQSNKDDVISYIEILTQSAINKEKEIRRKFQLTMDMIESEIVGNQKSGNLTYQYPNILEIAKLLRLDTGIYSKEYKSFKFLIDNYSFGCTNIKRIGFKTKRGQNLQVSCIGTSTYSDDPEKYFYKLITSADLTDFGTHTPYRYLGNRRKLQRVNHGDIMFSATGQAITSIGKVCVFINPPTDLISNINSFFLYKDNIDIPQSIFIAMMLLYYKNNEYIIKMIGRGNGGSFTEHHFDLVDIPNIPSSVQAKIVQLYHNTINIEPLVQSKSTDFLANDIKWNNQAGISELDNTSKKIKNQLNKIIRQIVLDEKVEINYSFLSQ